MNGQEIVVFKPVEAAIADLTARYKGLVFDVTAPEGMQDAKAAYKDINGYSIALEKARTAEKAASLAYGRLVDSEAKRIADQLDALRLPIKTTIETETKRAEREREEKVRLEIERIAAEEKAKKDAEEAKLSAERAEIKRQQEELAKAQRDREEADRQARAKIEAEERAAKARIEAQEREAREARDKADREAREAREAKERELKAIQDRIEAEQRKEREAAEAKATAERRAKEEAEAQERARLRAIQEAAEAKAKAERDAEEAKQREIEQQKRERMDGLNLLARFVMKFGEMPEFAGIAKTIDDYLKSKSNTASPPPSLSASAPSAGAAVGAVPNKVVATSR